MTPRSLMIYAAFASVAAATGPARAAEPTPRQACLQSDKSVPTWKANCQIAIEHTILKVSQIDAIYSASNLGTNNITIPTAKEITTIRACQDKTGPLVNVVVNCENANAYFDYYVLLWSNESAAAHRRGEDSLDPYGPNGLITHLNNNAQKQGAIPLTDPNGFLGELMNQRK